MQKADKLKALILGIAIIILSCASRQMHIRLSTALIKKAEPNEVKKVNLEIDSIADLRQVIDPKSPVFTYAREAGGYCRNAERHYPQSLLDELRKSMAAYFLNRQVYQGSENSPAYTLTGSLRKFYAEQQASKFPLPKDRTPSDRSGYFRNAGYSSYTTPGAIEIEFSDLYLTDTRNGRKYSVAPVNYRNVTELEIDDDCFLIYSSINHELLLALKLLEDNINAAIPGNKR